MFFLRYYFWIAPHVLLGIVLIGLNRRRLLSQLPFFFSYSAFEIVRFAALLTINLLPSFSKGQYHWILVLGLGASILLQFGVIYELTSDLFVSRSLATALNPVLRWTAAALLLVGTAVSARLAVLGGDRVVNLFHLLDLSSSVILTGLLLVLFLFTRVLQISWRSPVVGVALGFGIFAAVDVATAGFHPAIGSNASITVDLFQMAAYHVCVLVWITYLFLPEKAPVFIGRGLQEQDIELWNQELQKMVQR